MGVSLHAFSLGLPKHELYETGSQMRRASKSVSANIVEGFGRRAYKADFVRILTMALASCDETTEWLEYVKDCYPQMAVPVQQELDRATTVRKKLIRFLQAVEAQHRT